ncbi:nephrocystin-3 [Lethenteron reissneri]|uniref:nephrocystin-3 n=1 Tax=Lethenteron reissneri TaxID=7753 RepID=UPI002AB60F20|nr:nephrocystin-3 [Lethenteron reissneri]XP_061410634.1 nephrocystin-3 [Lethenteron reissneri]XP_061410635.1 nephrocystin-3 [Lethenteron reissneri]
MGTGSSLTPGGAELAPPGLASRGCTEIPIEMKPRQKLVPNARLRSVGSARRFKGASFRSVTSVVDLELAPELERLRKEYEIFRVTKSNEVADMKRKEEKLDSENKRLRAELQALQKSCQKLRVEKEAALEGRDQAMERAASFQQDRDKVQRQFKIFREAKEKEVQDLLRAKRDLEGRLQRLQVSTGVGGAGSAAPACEGGDSDGDETRTEVAGSAVMGSHPSMGSMVLLANSMRGPELAHSLVDLEGTFTSVNRDDWNSALSGLLHGPSSGSHAPHNNTLRCYIMSCPDTQQHADLFVARAVPELQSACEARGHFLVAVSFGGTEQKALRESRRREIAGAALLLLFLGRSVPACVAEDCEEASLRQAEASRPLAIARWVGGGADGRGDAAKGDADSPGALVASLAATNAAQQVIEYSDLEEGIERLQAHVGRVIKRELRRWRDGSGVDKVSAGAKMIRVAEGPGTPTKAPATDGGGGGGRPPSSPAPGRPEGSNGDGGSAANGAGGGNGEGDEEEGEEDEEREVEEEGPGDLLWDRHLEQEQQEALQMAAQASFPLGLEKYLQRLHDLVATPGPTPPLLVSGGPGSGKSLLLTKWIETLQTHSPSSLVLYHLVGQPFSSSADPALMVRRFIVKLLQHMWWVPVAGPDGARLLEELPFWLERLSARRQGCIILLIDSIDRIQHAERHLPWLIDPLPVNLRVVVSVNVETCPQPWRLWPTLHLDALSPSHVKTLIQKECSTVGLNLTDHQVKRLDIHFRSATTCNALYTTLVARMVSRARSSQELEEALHPCLQCHDTPTLFRLALRVTESTLRSARDRERLRELLCLACVARDGVSESELQDIDPGLGWALLSPLLHTLQRLCVLSRTCGLIKFRHLQAQEAARQEYVGVQGPGGCQVFRARLAQHFSSRLAAGRVTWRVADELPWLLHHDAESRPALQDCLLNLHLCRDLYKRGRFSDLVSHWQAAGRDRTSLAALYMEALKQREKAPLAGTASSSGGGGDVGSDGSWERSVSELADLHETLGRFLRDLGLYSQAVLMLQRSLELRETALDPDHPSVAGTLHRLAAVYLSWRKPGPAQQLYEQALALVQNAHGHDDPRVARHLDALAALHHKHGRLEQAESLRRQALKIRQKAAAERGNVSGFELLRRRLLQLEEGPPGGESADAARSLNELGVLYYLQGNPEIAELFFQRSLTMREKVLGPDHPDCAQSLNNLASLCGERGENERAQCLYERALHNRQRALSRNHPALAYTVKQLALLYKKGGKLEKALPLYQLTVEIREKASGPNHPSVATALVNLAVVYSQLKRHDEALPLYERALRTYEDSLGPLHPRVAETLRNLAVLRYEQGDVAGAAELYKRATEIRGGESLPAAAVTGGGHRPQSLHSSGSEPLGLALHSPLGLG